MALLENLYSRFYTAIYIAHSGITTLFGYTHLISQQDIDMFPCCVLGLPSLSIIHEFG